MLKNPIRLVLLGVISALCTALADDLADLKAAEELRLKLSADGKHVERNSKLVHDEFIQIFPQYPFACDREPRPTLVPSS